MIIRYAEEKNFIELRQFYDGMCKVLSEKDFLPEGDKGGFPPDEMIKDAIKERNQFIGIEDGRIVAAYIMNHDRDEAYHAVKWLIDANDNETPFEESMGIGYSKIDREIPIELNKEIPICVKIGTSSNRMEVLDITEDFRKIECDAGIAVTITVSDEIVE